ncbi:unnamed protein product [Owenia fusiformis]|uniref:Uncharacterized protein n=1 Tax=Owenia fusiformis TaxID=6347 RepID=A0A8J1XTQ3_OWEFU|nr:unnamed protein product [Owenia fusiformis]
MKVVFMALLQCLSITRIRSGPSSTMFSSQTTTYETIIDGKMLPNAELITVFVENVLQCLRECNKRNTCVSVNFKVMDPSGGGKRCVLSNEIIGEDFTLQEDNDYQYVQMSKQHLANSKTTCSREVNKRKLFCDAKSCGSSKHTYNGHCYEFVESPMKNYDDASMYCQASNGYLVSVNDELESNFLNTIIDGTADMTYMGLKQNNPSVNIYETWNDGTPLGFTSWAAGQPGSAGEQCVTFYPPDQTWHDVSCGYTCQFICESQQGPSLDSLDGPYFLQPKSDNSSYIGVLNTNQLWLSNQTVTSEAFYFQTPGNTRQNNSVSLISDDKGGNVIHVAAQTVSLQNEEDHASNVNFSEESTFTFVEDEFWPGFITLYSSTGDYLRVSGGQLVAQVYENTDVFKSSASFQLIISP